jgi:hypothetical protein
MRLVDQLKYMREVSQDMVDSGIKYAVTTGRGQYWKDTSHHYGQFDHEMIWCFEAEIDFPDNGSKYPVPEYNQAILMAMKKRIKQLTKSLAHIRYYIRNVELAFANKHRSINDDGMPKQFFFPAWIKNSKWQMGYKQKGKRKLWQRLKLVQPGVGELSVSLRFRWYEKKRKVRKGR